MLQIHREQMMQILKVRFYKQRKMLQIHKGTDAADTAEQMLQILQD
jgi:hypothetical protein